MIKNPVLRQDLPRNKLKKQYKSMGGGGINE
jgi:hypothetical protein